MFILLYSTLFKSLFLLETTLYSKRVVLKTQTFTFALKNCYFYSRSENTANTLIISKTCKNTKYMPKRLKQGANVHI